MLLVKTWSPRRTVSVPVRQTSNVPAAAWTCVLFSVFHALQSSAAVHWSARTIQRSAKVTRPFMERVGLQPARYIQAAAYRTISRYRDMKCHDISISLLGYDMITRHDLCDVHASLQCQRSLIIAGDGATPSRHLLNYPRPRYLRCLLLLVGPVSYLKQDF